MKVVSGTFNGTGAALYMGIGFEPDFVEIENLASTTNQLWMRWDRNMRSAEMPEGVRFLTPASAGNSSATRLTTTTGIQPYAGGYRTTAASTVYLVKDPTPDKRSANVVNGYSAINAWTLDTAGTFLGHWNDQCNTTYVGVGSRINIGGKWYLVLAITGNGEATDEVTLDRVAGTGDLQFLSGMYDFIGAPAADIVIPAGFYTADTTVNASGKLCRFVAGVYDQCQP